MAEAAAEALAEDPISSIEDQLAAAAMKVLKAHMLLSGVVDQAVRPAVKEFASASLELLEEAVREMGDTALALKAHTCHR